MVLTHLAERVGRCTLMRASLLAMSLAATQLDAQQASPVEARVDSLFRTFANSESPGCAVGASGERVPSFTRGYGSAVIEHGIPVTPQTAFNIGSISKQFTAFATLLLAHDGLFSLEDDIRRFVPELPANTPPIRVRDLLYHTSGLRDYTGLARLSGRPVRDPERPVEEFLALMSRQRALNFVPGTQHAYVHSDYNVLGVLLERATGKSLGDVLSERIWVPLGMTSTRLLNDGKGPIRYQALSYLQEERGAQARFPVGALPGGSDVYTTAEDLLKWNAHFDMPTVGSNQLMAEFLARPQLPSGEMIPYVHGVRHGIYRGRDIVYRGGHGNHFSADQLHFPAERVSIVVLCNTQSVNTHALARAVADIVVADRLGAQHPEPGIDTRTLSANERQRLTGSYYPIDTPWLELVVNPSDAGLQVTSDETMRPMPLQRLSDGRWALSSTRITFSADPLERTVATVTVNETDPPLVLTKQSPAATWRPSTTELAQYAGAFFSDDVVTGWKIVSDGGRLVLRRPARTDVSLRPLRPDLFGADFGDGSQYVGIKAVRDDTRVVALEVTDLSPDGVVRNLRFDRTR